MVLDLFGGSAPAAPLLDPRELSQILRTDHLHRFSVEELTTRAPPVEWIWKPRIACAKVGLLGGAGGSLKSSLTVGLANHRAIGRPFLGGAVRRGSTLFVTSEDGVIDYRRKIQAWTLTMGDLGETEIALIAQHVRVLDVTGRTDRFVRRERSGGYVIDPFVESVAELLSFKDLDGVDLVVIETASRFGSDETNEGAAAMINACEVIARRGPAVLLVGHTAKANAREGYVGQHAFRGASAFSDNARGELVLAPLDASTAEMHGIAPEDAQRYSILATPKPHPTVRPPEPLILERVSPPIDGLGGVLRLRDSSPEATAAATVARNIARRATGEKLQAFVAGLVAKGQRVTRNKLRGYAPDLGLSKDRLPRAVVDALADGFLVEGPGGQGGGLSLLPGKSPEVAGPEPISPGGPAWKSPESPEPKAGTTSPATSGGENVEVAGTRPKSPDVSQATSRDPDRRTA
jgi:hypothetical protein